MASDHAAAPLLTGPQAGDILATALATTEIELESWTVDSVNARPGAETSVGYDVVAGGERIYLIASTVELTDEQRAAAKAVRLASDDGEVHVWRHPADPYLPGLADACIPETLAPRLSAATGRSITIESLDMMVMRPMRRAVLRVRTVAEDGRRTWYVKVVRPERAEAMLARHRMCDLAPLALDAGDGIVVVQEADGVPMTRALHRPDGSDPAQIDPQMLLAAMDRLPEEATALDARPPVPDRVSQYARMAIDEGLPKERVEALEHRIGAVLASAPSHPTVATHGDLHAANIYLDDAAAPSRIEAVIDLDTLGPGRRIDDCACMLAHMMVLPQLDAEGYRGVPPVAERLLQVFGERFGLEELRARVSANILSLVAGAEDDGVAAAWLGTAESVLEDSSGT
ncbi:phosphotransferase [Demequina sp. SO4-18]|uniref:phosphotransferase n=1 Tax=Demequina sp. SO4-18 TaxID=3401026 RepID=UPI003B5B764A